MQWVDGLPVNQYIDEYIDDPALLKQLVNNFPPIVEQLRANNLAHCDLQHGNIMVTPENEFKLVDYDGMFTTAFRGKSPELGHANFQHPRRTPDFYNEHVDNFGALVCYLSIMAIAENPDLFKKYYAADNLLLTANDYRNPKDSEVIKTLKSQDNEKVKQLATLLEKCCLVDVLQVPDFLEVVEKLKTGEIANMVATDVSPTPAPAPAPAQAATGGGAAGGWWDQSTTESKPAGSAAPTTPQKTAAPATPSYLAGSTASRAPTPKTPSYANAARRPASPTPKTPPPSMRAEQPKPKAPPPPPTQIAPAGEDNNTQLLLIGAMIAGLVLLLIFMMAKAAS
jgi:serine/threonine protein kinase